MLRKQNPDLFHGFPKECFMESLANKDNPEWLARQAQAATQQREAARKAREQRQRAAKQIHIQRQEKAGRREDAQRQKSSGLLSKVPPAPPPTPQRAPLSQFIQSQTSPMPQREVAQYTIQPHMDQLINPPNSLPFQSSKSLPQTLQPVFNISPRLSQMRKADSDDVVMVQITELLETTQLCVEPLEPQYKEYYQGVQYFQQEPMRQQSFDPQAQAYYQGVDQQSRHTQASNSPDGNSPKPKKPRIEELGPEDLAKVTDYAWELMSRMDSGIVRPTA